MNARTTTTIALLLTTTGCARSVADARSAADRAAPVQMPAARGGCLAAAAAALASLPETEAAQADAQTGETWAVVDLDGWTTAVAVAARETPTGCAYRIASLRRDPLQIARAADESQIEAALRAALNAREAEPRSADTDR